MTRAFALLFLLILVLMPCSAQRGLPTTSVEPDLQDEIENKLDLGNAHIEQTAVTMARDYPGEYSINQVGAIYSSLVQGWSYYSDPNFRESYKNANLSLQDGVGAGTVGVGDCDDFAILIASLIESLGGSTRIIFSQDEETGQGHAYAEAYLGRKDDPRLAELENWIKGEFGTSSIPGMSFEDEYVWINLDYNSSYIGGPIFGGEKASRKIAWVTGNKTAPKIIPLIDSMDDLSGWKAIKDDTGSNISMKLMPSRRGKAIELEYDLKENGWVGIAKNIDGDILAELKGINLSYFLDNGQVELEIRLEDENGTAFGSTQPIQKGPPQWDYLEALFEDFKKIDLNATGPVGDKIDLDRIDKLVFIIHSSPYENDTSGQGSITLDQIRGVMRIPKDSPWAKAEVQREMTLAKDLASQSELARDNPAKLIESLKLAVESLSTHETLEGDLAIRRCLVLLPRCMAELSRQGPVTAVTFNPDGSRIATASNDYTALLLDASSGDELLRLKHNRSVKTLAFSPDGRRLATGSDDQTARIWDTYTGKELQRLEHNGGVNAVAFSPDGRYLATCSNDNTARIWMTSTGKELHKLMHNGSVSVLAFSPDGKKLATASYDNTTRIWDTDTGKELHRLEHNSFLLAIAFSPDGGKLLTDLATGSVILWDAVTAEELLTLEYCLAFAVAFSSDGRKLATASLDGTARIWDASTGEELVKIDHDACVVAVAFSPDGRKLATAPMDNTARIWDAETGKELKKIEHASWVKIVAFSPEGRKLATGSLDGTTRIWDLTASGEPEKLENGGWVNHVSFSRDGSVLAAGSNDGTVSFWNVNTSKGIERLDQGVSFIDHLLSPDGRKKVTSSWNIVSIRDAVTGQELQRLEHGNLVTAASSNLDGRLLATSSTDSTARIWDADTGKELLRFELNGTTNSVDFSPDGTLLATGSADNIARIWDANTGKELQRLEHDGWVLAVAFSPDGTKLATGSAYGTARIWDVDTGKELQRLEQDGWINTLAFNPDGNKLATGNSKGIARVWVLPSKELICEACSRLGLNLTTPEWREQYCSGCDCGKTPMIISKKIT